jgi:hypothetical protein
VLIDFGKARFIPVIDPSGTEEIPPGMTLSVLSPWHLQRQPIGPRDDLFRMFEILLNLVDTQKVEEYYVAALENREYLSRAKLNPNLVRESKIIEDVVLSYDKEENAQIRESFLSEIKKIHKLVIAAQPGPETHENILTIATSLRVPLVEKLGPGEQRNH